MKRLIFFFTTLISNFVIPLNQNTQTIYVADCSDSVIVCGNSNINLDVSGIGTQELSGSNTCSSQENNSLWLQVTVITDGTLGFTLTPNSTSITEDYDFFVFGPDVPCNNIGQAIRCSTTNPQSAGQGNNLTGMNGTETDTSEGPGPNGNSFVSWLNVIAGETYFIVIDRPIGNSAFSLEWTGTAEFPDPPINESGSGTALNLEDCDVIAPFSDGLTEFNLIANTNSIIGTQTDVLVTYHETESDANIGINPLSSPYTNIVNPQPIFVRITNNTTGCFEITDFELNVLLGPNFAVPTDFILCDNADDGDETNGHTIFDLQTKNSEILNGQNPLDINISYHETLAEAELGILALPNLYYNTIPNSQQIFVRIEKSDSSNCFDTTSFFIKVFDSPTANQPTNIDICDDDNDGLFVFDFTIDVDAQVIGTQETSTFSTHYFESQTDADTNTNEIIMPYQNISNPQKIFVRIENDGFTDCYDTTSFFIEIFDTPTANSFGNFEVCDDNLDGNNMNGQTTVNLFDINPLVLDTQDILAYNITYHSSQLDADSGNAALPFSYYNTNPNVENIFVRIENILNTDCYDTTTFNLVVNIAPETFNDTLIQCDEDGSVDGFTTFNLNEANDVLTDGIANRSTKFFLSLADAQANINEIDGNSYNNISNPQTIHIQVINDITGCVNFAELILDVSLTNANDAILTSCDNDGIEDGFYTFNLSDADADVLNGLPPNVTLNYYITYNNALLEQNPLPNSYINTTPYSQTIYVRVENDNDCFGINQVQLNVFELPDIVIEEELFYCLNSFPQTITLTSGVINDLPSNYTYSWSTGETTSEIEINQSGTFNVTVTNANGCSKDRTITVLPSNIATINSIDVVDATQNNTITVSVSGEGTYEFALDDSSGPYQVSNLFENVAPGLHTVYVMDTKNSCGIVEKIVSVIGFPKFFTPNNDSFNDTWQVYGLSKQFQPNSTIFIYDRYGKLLKQLDPTGIGWDGTFNGYRLPSSDYWFYVTLQDGRIFANHFTLKR